MGQPHSRLNLPSHKLSVFHLNNGEEPGKSPGGTSEQVQLARLLSSIAPGNRATLKVNPCLPMWAYMVAHLCGSPFLWAMFQSLWEFYISVPVFPRQVYIWGFFDSFITKPICIHWLIYIFYIYDYCTAVLFNSCPKMNVIKCLFSGIRMP